MLFGGAAAWATGCEQTNKPVHRYTRSALQDSGFPSAIRYASHVRQTVCSALYARNSSTSQPIPSNPAPSQSGCIPSLELVHQHRRRFSGSSATACRNFVQPRFVTSCCSTQGRRSNTWRDGSSAVPSSSRPLVAPLVTQPVQRQAPADIAGIPAPPCCAQHAPRLARLTDQSGFAHRNPVTRWSSRYHPATP